MYLNKPLGSFIEPYYFCHLVLDYLDRQFLILKRVRYRIVRGQESVSDNLAISGFRRCLHTRKAALIAAACAGFILGERGPALASAGCSAFYGRADDQTKGEGGNRVGAGFSKGDMLVITIHNAPGMMGQSVNLLQYTSPDGPSHALVQDTSDSFAYTVPASTNDFIYLNLGSVNKGTIVTWCCTPARSSKTCDTTGTITINPTR